MAVGLDAQGVFGFLGKVDAAPFSQQTVIAVSAELLGEA
jgi:hypothetical protein